MATLTVKGVPEELVTRLKREAAQHRRSLNGEVLHLLEKSVVGSGNVEQMLRELDEHRVRIPGPPITAEEIKAAIEEGRE